MAKATYKVGADVLPSGIASFYIKRNGVKLRKRFNLAIRGYTNRTDLNAALDRTRARAEDYAQRIQAREGGRVVGRSSFSPTRKKRKSGSSKRGLTGLFLK